MRRLTAAFKVRGLVVVQNEGMPARVDASDIPEDASRARKVVDGTARILALKYLLGAPNSTRPEIADGAGISPAAAQEELLELERLGYVTVDVRGPRNGRLIHYTAVPEAIGQDLAALTRWLLS
jgi:hypothetical protein